MSPWTRSACCAPPGGAALHKIMSQRDKETREAVTEASLSSLTSHCQMNMQ